mgnify:CR=1 FL=1
METKITMLPVAVLHPHRDNPRKELGDLTELAESIKTNGVMQNLTVIPAKEAEPDTVYHGYTVIIGHRRLEAAKLAGLTEVPCVITHMDRAKQLSTMLLENIQRNDLTVYEQAQGFQLMMDMGSTVKEISALSGFSEKTVKHRLEIAKLDGSKLKLANEDRQLSLAEFAELEKVDDIKKRNELIDYIGTSNFKWQLDNAVAVQEIRKLEKFALPTLMQFATKSDYSKCWDFTLYATLKTESDVRELTVPEAKKGVKYYYTVNRYDIKVYKKEPKPKEEKAADAAEKEKKLRTKAQVQALGELAERCYESRKSFILEIDERSITYQTIFEFISAALLAAEYSGIDRSVQREFIGSTEFNAYTCLQNGEREKFFRTATPRKRAIVAAYSCCGDGKDKDVHDYDGNYTDGYTARECKRIYDALKILGYEMSDEEREYIYGIHKAYRIKEGGR